MLRPTLAKKVADNIYEVLATEDYSEDLEEWKFVPGQLVECELEQREDGYILVAKKRTTQP